MTYLSILLFNFLLLYFIKTDRKYWLVTIPIWTILISVFIIWRTTTDRQISQLDASYWQSAEYNKNVNPDNWRGDEKIFDELEKTRAHVKKYNRILLNSIFLQTILTFISQFIGYKRTILKKTYKRTLTIFGILFILNLLLFLLISIVPTGPFF